MHQSFQHRSEYPVKTFVRTEEELVKMPEEQVLVLVENLTLSVLFDTNVPGRFYMDGLDMLPETRVTEDEVGEVYFPSSDHEQLLYQSHTNDDSSYYPLIPGYYRIKVVLGGETYYTLIRIRPKQVTEEQWEWMRNDIEDTLHGLAQDLLRKNSHLSVEGESPIPLTYMRQWLLFREEKARLLHAAEEIMRAPRSEIYKTYKLVPDVLAKRVGEKSIQFRSQHPEKEDVLVDTMPTIGFDLPENRWLYHILQFFQAITQELLTFLQALEVTTNRELGELAKWGKRSEDRMRLKRKVLEQVREMKRDAMQFRSVWYRSLETSWTQNIQPTLPQEVPMALTSDSRYRVLYQTYRKLKKQDITISLDPMYTYHWKQTDLLYEIWGYIQVVKGLQSEKLGFVPTKGWLFEEEGTGSSIQVPELRSGTYVEFQKGEVRVRVVYEEEIATTPEHTSLHHPVYTSSYHRKPDCRIDVYDAKGHIGTLLLDFKYRPLPSIWDHSKIRTQKQNKTMRQLDAYSTSCRSGWFLKDRFSDRIIRQFRPVFEVWPVYPEKHRTPQQREADSYHIRPMDLTPGSNNEHFLEKLEWAFAEMQGLVSDLERT